MFSAGIKKSVLNPLATCFVPASAKSSIKHEHTLPNSSTKSLTNNSTSNDSKKPDSFQDLELEDNKPQPDLVQPCLERKKGLELNLPSKVPHNDLKTAVENFLMILACAFIPRRVSYIEEEIDGMSVDLKLSGYIEDDIDDFHEISEAQDNLREQQCNQPSLVTQLSAAETFPTEQINEGKCNCPPMFGYVIPPNMFGNPFNLKSYCSEKCVHMGKYQGNLAFERESQKVQSSRVPATDGGMDRKDRLEKYSNELKDIVKEVCTILILNSDVCDEFSYKSDSDTETDKGDICCGDSGYRSGRSSFGSCDIPLESNGIKPRRVWNDSHIIEPEVKLAEPSDDEIHSLLDEGIFMEEETTDRSIGSTFSNADFELPSTKFPAIMCNPPCSSWCDSMNTGQCLNTNDLTVAAQSGIQSKKLLLQKRACTRSFSNDCISAHTAKNRLLGNSFNPQRMFIPTNQINYVKFRKFNESRTPVLPPLELKDRGCTKEGYRHEDGMWGLFDGEDSLWQPLPDCIQSDPSLKLSNKKGRDLKRQRSWI